MKKLGIIKLMFLHQLWVEDDPNGKSPLWKNHVIKRSRLATVSLLYIQL